MYRVRKRLEELEALYSNSKIPTYQEWQTIWKDFSDLDKSIFILQCENLDGEQGNYLHYMQAVKGYLERMGLINNNAETLKELALKMQGGDLD